jgi:hypothetical protein
MKTPLITTALFCAVSLGLSNVAFAAPSNNNDAAKPATENAAKTAEAQPYDGLLLGTKIVGSEVKNLQNQDIGTIDDLVVNPDTGRVRFAVLSVAGASDKVVLPWGAVSLEKNSPGQAPTYVVDANKDKLEKAPKFDASKLTALYAATSAQPIFDYYDIIFFDDVPAPGQTAGTKDKNSKSTSTATATEPSASNKQAANH